MGNAEACQISMKSPVILIDLILASDNDTQACGACYDLRILSSVATRADGLKAGLLTCVNLAKEVRRLTAAGAGRPGKRFLQGACCDHGNGRKQLRIEKAEPRGAISAHAETINKPAFPAGDGAPVRVNMRNELFNDDRLEGDIRPPSSRHTYPAACR